MPNAIVMRQILRTVPLQIRKDWAFSTGQDAPACDICTTACPYPSHWSGPRLHQAWEKLITPLEREKAEHQHTDERVSGSAILAAMQRQLDTLANELKRMSEEIAHLRRK